MLPLLLLPAAPAPDLEAAPNQIRCLDEERAAVATKTRYDLIGKWVRGRIVQIVVVPDVEGRARTRRPTKQRLRA